MVLREERGQRQLKGEIKIERIFSTVRGIRNFECSSFSGFFIKFPTSIFRNSDFMTVRFGFSFFVAVMLAGCVGDVQKRRNADDPVSDSEVLEAMQEYDVSRYFPGNEKDSLLANMVTYIYRRPAKAKAEDRTKPAFRSYYVRSMLQFEYVYHHSPDDSVHYYYLIRPARSLEGTHRGVGGKFTTNDQLELVTFEEMFNTTILEDDVLRKKGLILFEEMVTVGNLERFLTDQNLIEWPDHRLKYDKKRREWRYIN